MVDALVLVLAALLMLVGVLGTLVPALPGVPLVWAVALLYGWWEGFRSISPAYLGWTAALAVAALLGERYAAAWGSRRFGGSRAGAWGAFLGSVVGLFFMPVGLVAGPFLGALAGELLAGRSGEDAVRASFGSVMGVFLGTAFNFAVALILLATFLYRTLGGV